MVIWAGAYREMKCDENSALIPGNQPGLYRRGRIGNTPVLAYFPSFDATGEVIVTLPENGFFTWGS